MAVFKHSTIYVDQLNGNDNNSGLEFSYPVKSIEKAFEIIHKMRIDGAKHPMDIALLSDYFARDGIEFTAEKMLNGITLTSWGNTRKRIIGGCGIYLDEWKTFSENDCNTLAIDPMVHYEDDSFAIDPDSPVYKFGFCKIK